MEFISLSKSDDILATLTNFFHDSPEGLIGVSELTQMLDYASLLGIKNQLNIDVTLARGLSYYTGAIVEVVANAGNFKPSIGGGGRYDNLTGIFGLPDVSGVGISFGLDRIYDVLEELKLFPENLRQKETMLLFCHFDEASQLHALNLCALTRNAGVAAEVYPDLTKKIAKQLEYANKNQIRYAVIIGSNEIESGKYTRKDLNSGTQVELSATQLFTQL
jgi:histidyl-tRNA synthetase